MQSLAALPYANVTVKVDVDVPRRNYLVEHPEGFPGIDVERKFLRRYPSTRWPPSSSGASARSTTPSSSSSASRASRRARSSARAASSAPTTSTCAASTARPRSPSTRSGGPKSSAAGARPGVRALGAHDARHRAAADRREVPRPDDQPGPGHRRRLRRARPARRQRARAGLLSDGQPVDPLQADLAGHRRSRSSATAAARRCSTAPSAAPIRPARPSSRSRRWRP